MKLKTCHTALLTTVFFALLVPFGAFAQDSRAGFDIENATKDPLKQDQDNLGGGENTEIRSNTKSSTSSSGTETVVVRDAEMKTFKATPKTEKSPKEAEKAKKEEDPLSFNFLYYIIEKFKFSDIVE